MLTFAIAPARIFINVRESSAVLQDNSTVEQHILEDRLARTHNFVYFWFRTIHLLINTHWKISWPGHSIMNNVGSIFGHSPERGKQPNSTFRESSAFLQDNSTVDKHTLEDRMARTHNYE